MTVDSLNPVLSHDTSFAIDRSARALILDDQLQVAEFLAEMLKILGYEAVAQSDPQRALQSLEDEHFDVVISDFKMPEMSGIEFFHAATAIDAGIVSRFVFLTGDLFNIETEATLKATGVPLLGKPFRLDTVEQVVGEVIARDRAAASLAHAAA
jgi:CheY-like chemotaxis protein